MMYKKSFILNCVHSKTNYPFFFNVCFRRLVRRWNACFRLKRMAFWNVSGYKIDGLPSEAESNCEPDWSIVSCSPCLPCTQCIQIDPGQGYLLRFSNGRYSVEWLTRDGCSMWEAERWQIPGLVMNLCTNNTNFMHACVSQLCVMQLEITSEEIFQECGRELRLCDLRTRVPEQEPRNLVCAVRTRVLSAMLRWVERNIEDSLWTWLWKLKDFGYHPGIVQSKDHPRLILKEYPEICEDYWLVYYLTSKNHSRFPLGTNFVTINKLDSDAWSWYLLINKRVM